MSRTPAYPDGDPAYITPLYNRLAANQRILRCVDACLGPSVLPRTSQAPFSFRAADAPLYVATRQAVADTAAQIHALEKTLDEQFWNAQGQRVVFLEGGRGCGKSTLIAYYLQCYCPHEGIQKEAFDRKCIVIFDVGTIPTSADFTEQFFYHCKEWMEHRCEEYGISIESIMPPTTSVRQWVYTAIKTLSNHPSFKWLVIVFDNMDQVPPEVQKHVLGEVNRLLHLPQSRAYRIYVPLWPATIPVLKRKGWDKVPIETITVTDIDRTQLIDTRFRALRALIANHLTDSHVSSDMQEWIGYQEWFCGTILTKANCRLLHDLTDGDLRAQLELWKGLLCGVVSMECITPPRNGQVSRYEFADALLTGHYCVWDPARTRIANIFRCGNATSNARDLLVGCHFLQLLENGVKEVDTLVRIMTTFRYAHDSIKAAIRHFVHGNIMHRGPHSEDGGIDWQICIHARARDALRDLVTEPAYVDNAAMITPIGDAMPGSTHRTVSYRESDFTMRVDTTMRLIRQVRADEEEFVRSLGRQSPEEVQQARVVLMGHNMYYMWNEIASRYRDRLLTLKGSKYLRNVRYRWWEDTLSDPIFTSCRDTRQYMIV